MKTDYAHLAKAANERMRQFEKKGITSPAYRGAQTVLYNMKVKGKGAAGRRFPERLPKYMDEAAQSAVENFLNRFMGVGEDGYKTSTQRGFKEYQNEIFKTADEKYGLSQKGISADDWFKIWERQEQKEKDRKFESGEVVRIIKAYADKGDEAVYSWEEVADLIREADDVSTAYENLGLDWEAVNASETLPWEDED